MEKYIDKILKKQKNGRIFIVWCPVQSGNITWWQWWLLHMQFQLLLSFFHWILNCCILCSLFPLLTSLSELLCLRYGTWNINFLGTGSTSAFTKLLTDLFYLLACGSSLDWTWKESFEH
jgi:hypothetical protein